MTTSPQTKGTIKKPPFVPRNKGGAPKKNIRREQLIRVRLTATERLKIETKAGKAGMKLSDWIRAAANSARVIPRLSSEDREHLHMLAGMANNLNQLTKLAHIGGILSIARKCARLLDEIDRVINYFNKDDRESSETREKL